ncbi:MAG: hypothetical protein JW855_05920 [Gammaproteobacteria bacterium]|nr:hypothetical protein [Gammaproteobacteria bacterium]
MRKVVFFLGVVCFFLVLTSCGFKLRGAMNLPPQMHRLYLQSDAPYSELTRELKQNLHLSKVHLMGSPDQAPVILAVSTETVNPQQITISSTDQSRIYTVNYSLSYEMRTPKGVTLIGPKTIQKQTNITLLANEVIGNSNKLSDVVRVMRQDAIYSMMLQLSSKEVMDKLKI